MNERSFGLSGILAITHSRYITDPLKGEITAYLCGGRDFPERTHGAAVHDACAEEILSQHAGLRALPDPGLAHGDEAAARAWVAVQKNVFGPSLPLAPLPPTTLAELMYQPQVKAWNVVGDGALLRVTLPTYAAQVGTLIDYAATNAGLAAAVNWVAERSGPEAAAELTRHILRTAGDAIAATSDMANLIEGLESELEHPNR